MTFAEFFAAISTEEALSQELIPGLLEYYREPTMFRAKGLLTQLGVPIPYEELSLFMKSVRRVASASQRSTRRGGRRRHGAKQLKVLNPDFFAIHRCIDMIHDLAHSDVLDGGALDSIFAQVPGMPSELCEHIRTILDTKGPKSVNKALVLLAEKVGNLTPGAAAVQIDLNPRKRVTALRADIYFANQVSEWLKRPTLELVLDNFFTEPIPPPKKLAGDAKTLYALNDPAPLRSLALCAFLQLVIGTWDVSLILPGSERALAVPPTAVREVRFLIGTFQTLDVGGYESFLKRWVRCLRMESAHFYALSAANFTYESVSVADAVTAAAAAASAIDPGSLRNTGIHSHGLFVPYRMPDILRGSVPVRSTAARTAPEFLAKFRDYFYTSYNKDWLRQVYTAYFKLSERDQARSDVTAFMAALFEINAIRDSLRADVALSRDAVFITGDHLALVYYAKRAERLGKERAGLGIDIKGAGDMNARIYPDPASARQLALLSVMSTKPESSEAAAAPTTAPKPPAT